MLTPLLRQVLTLGGVMCNSFGQGMLVAFTACIHLAAQQDGIPVTFEQTGWLGFANSASSVVGSVFCSLILDRCGRRLTHALYILVALAGWLLVYIAHEFNTLLIGRFLSGLGIGPTICVGSIVIGEYVQPKHRGWMINMKSIMFLLGSSVLHMVMYNLNWRTVVIVCVTPLLLALFLNATWLESPSWFISKNEFAKGEKIFYKIRGKDQNTTLEWRSMVRGQEEVNSQGRKKMCTNICETILMKDFWKPLLTLSVSFILLEANGRHWFAAYAPKILSGMSINSTHTFYYTVCIDVVCIVSSTISCFLIKSMKRRHVLLGSGAACCIILSCTALYLHLVSEGKVSVERTWIPLSLLCVFFIIANFGCTSIPLTLVGELIPLQHRGVGTGVMSLLTGLCFAVTMKVSPTLMDLLDIKGFFGVCALVTIVITVFMNFVLPETKDRTLQEISDYYKHGKFMSDYVSVSQNDATTTVEEKELKNLQKET